MSAYRTLASIPPENITPAHATTPIQPRSARNNGQSTPPSTIQHPIFNHGKTRTARSGSPRARAHAVAGNPIRRARYASVSTAGTRAGSRSVGSQAIWA